MNPRVAVTPLVTVVVNTPVTELTRLTSSMVPNFSINCCGSLNILSKVAPTMAYSIVLTPRKFARFFTRLKNILPTMMMKITKPIWIIGSNTPKGISSSYSFSLRYGMASPIRIDRVYITTNNTISRRLTGRRPYRSTSLSDSFPSGRCLYITYASFESDAASSSSTIFSDLFSTSYIMYVWWVFGIRRTGLLSSAVKAINAPASFLYHFFSNVTWRITK